MSRMFGTDGVRGVANEELTPLLAMQLGQAGAYVLTRENKHKPTIMVGCDTRMSGDMLANALMAGICSVGANAVYVGVIPTPAIAYLTKKYKVEAGVVISASHNPMEFNGIKFFDGNGYKLPDALEDEIEALIKNNMNRVEFPTGSSVGRIKYRKDAREEYINHAVRAVPVDLTNLKVVVDCAEGASHYTSIEALRQLGAQVVPIHNMPDGTNINANCGSTHMEELQARVVYEKANIGLAFDGDADRLLADLDKLDWPEKVKKMQADWIGKSYGAEVDFKVDGMDESITVYTTRPDTLWGATFMVLAPEHALASKLATDETRNAVEKYIYDASMKSNVDRMQDKEKTGVFTGSYAVNPLNGKKTPIWLSDYVLADYGTGAIMCVPAHDDRDFAFAKKFDLPIIQVIAKDGKEIENMTEAYTEANGTMINSGDWDGMESAVLKKEAPEMIEKMGYGKKTTNYKLRDWVFSRQRYWGEPIPIIHCPDCGAVPVPEEELPVLLPDVEKYEPTGTGESPLAAIDSWVNTTCPCCGKPAKRETNTMPQWAGSSWYFLRYVDNKNDRELVNKEKADKYLPVDMYIGGVEHAVLHLLYARFYTKFLHDIGVVDFDEPFKKLFNQGMVCGRDRETGAATKMSKSLGNIVSPDDMVNDYGCDALRMYELFIGPPELDSIWDDRGIDGVYRFLSRFYNMAVKNIENPGKETPELIKLRHKMVYDITTRLESFSLNTVISGFMEYNNKFVELTKKGGVDTETLKTVVRLIAPFAPHIGEELWEALGGTDTVFASGWPTYEEEAMKDNEITIPVQINGKTKATINIGVDEAKDAVLAKGKEAVADKLSGLTVIKEIYVPGKIVNIVAK